MKLSLQLLSPEMLNQRLKGYKLILIGQILFITSFLVVYELFSRYPFQNWDTILIALIGVLMIAVNYLGYRLIKELTPVKFIQNLILGLFILGVLIAVVAGTGVFNPASAAYKNLNMLSLTSSLISFIVLLYFMLIDIFKEKHEITYRLWGSACIYLLFASTFALIYTLTEMLIPAEFALEAGHDVFRFMPCYALSFYTIAGIDSPFEEFSMLVKNITVIESIFANLYIVLVVGRLLSK